MDLPNFGGIIVKSKEKRRRQINDKTHLETLKFV